MIMKISLEDQKDYWSRVGMLLSFVKQSRPNIANMTRDLSKANDGANPSVFKELLHVIRSLLDTKILALS